MSNYNNIVFEKQNNIGVLKINRPKALNALNTETICELAQVVKEIKNDPEVKVLIVTGEGRSFVAGADIVEMKDKTPEEARTFAGMAMEVFREIELMEKPVIAAVNGFALGGGCELSMSCDIRIAGEKAKFGQPEVGLGITPGFAGTQRLPRLVGTGKAKELIFTAKMISAEEAEKIGLANAVVPQEELMDKAMEMANQILANSPMAVKYAKSAINRGYETDIETGMYIEKDIFGLCFASEEQTEGMTAFVEKRKPDFGQK
ncbi:enoyl-CoA hydratase [Dethiosulfatibacter aminovorans DSM 17477]|uniref:Enoyl-CoA hydratase n=1 Tax=Dethiosulfatibacter aminovorans DSM 17477 TaxID=1121476 RepID=A0A1M6LIT2_9FIRM|nr:short-chain-enoyl-CoA hydratase [Dethiosulfatibacter aminovorans]SHJ71089.1 enoyl-CoA hydratase [Dethiosulfatibacter aminovorans DSM 17477]